MGFIASPSWGERSLGEQMDWTVLSDQQRTILAPLESEWSRLPDYQRRRLIGAAKAYPQLDSEPPRLFRRAPRLSQAAIGN